MQTIKFGHRELELGGKYLDADLRDCNGVLDDPAALRQRLADDGYLLVRGMHPRERVLEGRRAVIEKLDEEGVLRPGTDPMEGVWNRESPKYPSYMGRKGVAQDPRVRAVLEGKPIFDFFERLLGRPVLTFDYKWLRAVRPPDYTGAHYDVVYMGRGSIGKLNTCWTPFGDVSLEDGPLALCVGSHNLPGFERLRSTYGRMDVDRDRVSGWFSDDPVEIVEKFGGKWRTTEFRAGDVLIFSMYTMHMSLNIAGDRWRISCDTRFQPADEPVDERWVGENPKAHYAWFSEPEKMVPMSKAREDWGV